MIVCYVSMIVCCIDALYWWSGGGQVVHLGILFICSLGHLVSLASLSRWLDEALASLMGGGSESLIYLYSSLTHPPTDSQIQFNRLFDDSISLK